MKSLIRSIFVLFFVGITLVLFAKDDPIILFKEKSGKSFLLSLQNLQKETYHLALKDANGYALITEKLNNQNTFKKSYNLNNLPKGVYLFSVESDRKLIKQTIVVSNHLVSIREQHQEKILKPSLIFNYPFVDLNMLHFEEGKVEVCVKDLKDEIVYIGNLRDSGGISKRFDITDLPKGDYVIHIRTQNYNCQKEFSISPDFEHNSNDNTAFLPARD